MQTDPINIIFIGGGNMAQAIINGILTNNSFNAKISVIEPFAPTRENLAKLGNLTILEQANQNINLTNSIVIWAVKPQVLEQVAQQSITFLAKDALHLSVIAGITCAKLIKYFNSNNIVRAMPNTPALIGQGASGLFACEQVSPEQRQLINQIMQSCGITMWVEQEQLLDAITAVSGSGPAYVFYCLNAITQAGATLGLTTTQAQQLAIQTFIGAANLAKDSHLNLQQLQDNVTSKGGTTYAALSVFEQKNLAQILKQGMQACFERAQQLAKE